MSLMDDMARSVEDASKAIDQVTRMFPERTAGILTRKLQDLERVSWERLGLAGVVVVLPARLAFGVLLAVALIGGLYASTFGSAAVMAAGPSVVFGMSPLVPGDYLMIGILMAAVNSTVMIFAAAYILHLVWRREERTVFGSARWNDDWSAANRAGLRSRQDKWP